MCGRYLLKTALEELARIFGFTERPNLMPRYNIAPTLEVPVIRQRREPAGQRSIAALRWGLVLPWADDPKAGPPLINARAETLLEKPAFRGAAQKRRCLIPADGFYEWKKDGTKKVPFRFRRKDRGLFAFAGLWDVWRPPDEPDAEPLFTCTILTTQANEVVAPVHDRMPVILSDEAAWRMWLDPDVPGDGVAHLLRPAPADDMETYEVSPIVNSARNDSVECIQPVNGVSKGLEPSSTE